MTFYVGWDLGGAHLKAALVQAGRVKAVWQIACPLWRGLDHLDQAITSVLKGLPDHCIHGLTMTGEMVDLFDNRSVGVRILLDAFSAKVGGNIFLFVSGKFIPLSFFLKKPKPQKLASNNWQITKHYLTTKEKTALCIDIGSTTCDLIPINERKTNYQGHNDHTRLQYSELLYIGVVRTPLLALAKVVPFNGKWVPLIAEHFATTGDIYRILGLLPNYADQAETTDGKPKTKAASMQRLARMIGLDKEAAPEDAWHKLARYFYEIQLQHLTRACLYQLSRRFPRQPILVGAGVGRFLVKTVAQRLELPYQDFGNYLLEDCPKSQFSAADCAPAVALAYLLETHLETVA